MLIFGRLVFVWEVAFVEAQLVKNPVSPREKAARVRVFVKKECNFILYLAN